MEEAKFNEAKLEESGAETENKPLPRHSEKSVGLGGKIYHGLLILFQFFGRFAKWCVQIFIHAACALAVITGLTPLLAGCGLVTLMGLGFWVVSSPFTGHQEMVLSRTIHIRDDLVVLEMQDGFFMDVTEMDKTGKIISGKDPVSYMVSGKCSYTIQFGKIKGVQSDEEKGIIKLTVPSPQVVANMWDRQDKKTGLERVDNHIGFSGLKYKRADANWGNVPNELASALLNQRCHKDKENLKLVKKSTQDLISGLVKNFVGNDKQVEIVFPDDATCLADQGEAFVQIKELASGGKLTATVRNKQTDVYQGR